MKPEVLEEAIRLVSGDRQDDYGTPADNHGCTAVLWTTYIHRRMDALLRDLDVDCDALDVEDLKLDARDVCNLNILQKVSRDAWRRKGDNQVDIAGYAQNADWCA